MLEQAVTYHVASFINLFQLIFGHSCQAMQTYLSYTRWESCMFMASLTPLTLRHFDACLAALSSSMGIKSNQFDRPFKSRLKGRQSLSFWFRDFVFIVSDIEAKCSRVGLPPQMLPTLTICWSWAWHGYLVHRLWLFHGLDWSSMRFRKKDHQ